MGLDELSDIYDCRGSQEKTPISNQGLWVDAETVTKETEKWVKFIFACVEPEVSVEHPGKHVQWQLICNAKYIASSQ